MGEDDKDQSCDREIKILLKEYGIIRESAARVAKAVERTVESYRDARVEQEPQFTDRMLGRIEEAMCDYEVKGVRWKAKTLTSQGPDTQEKEYGADFLGVLDIDLSNYSVKKGFLAQAKRIEPDGYFPPVEYRKLQSQCEKMLFLSPESFVFLYSKEGVRVVPAISIKAANSCNPHDLYSRSVSRFFEEHFQCFIGDGKIKTANEKSLKLLQERFNARFSLYLSAISLYRLFEKPDERVNTLTRE